MKEEAFKSHALTFDKEDPLDVYRDKFVATDANLIYLDGNSLGKLPIETQKIIKNTVDHEWGQRLIRSWNEDWYTKNMDLGDKIAPIIGAQPGEVAVSDSTSINLYKLAHAALRLNKGKTRIVSDELNFPSDLYILEGLVKEFGENYELVIVQSKDGIGVEEQDLSDAVNENTALVSLSHVVFKSAFRYNMPSVTRMAHDRGALVLWDLSHSAGAVPGELNQSNADMAVGCTYKYLNGGPGSPAFLYVRKVLQEQLSSPICGWFGDNRPFNFELNYQAGEGIKRFLSGTPPILSMKAIAPTLEMMHTAGMDQIRKKSIRQSEFLLELAETFLYALGFKPGSPADADQRGSHLSFKHPEAYRLCQALIDPEIGDAVVIPDFREPNNIRLGITPLYMSFCEIFRAVMEIKQIMEDKSYEQFSPLKDKVT